MSKNEKNALKFANRWPGWHSYAKDTQTTKAIEGLKSKGLVEVNEFRQFKARDKA